MDVKPYEEKVRELQSHLPLLENIIKGLEGDPSKADRYQKFTKLHKLVESTVKGARMPMDSIMKIDRMIKEVVNRSKLKVILRRFRVASNSHSPISKFVTGHRTTETH